MNHNPKQRIENLWKQLRAESSWLVQCHVIRKMYMHNGRMVRIHSFPSLEEIRQGDTRKILSMWTIYGRAEWPWGPMTQYATEESMLTNTLSMVRRLKSAK